MQAIRIGVVRSGQYNSADGFQVYSDGGSGEMDWEHPVTARRYLFWEDAPTMAGHLLSGHLMNQHIDSVGTDGHLESAHLLDEHLLPAAMIVYETDPFVFGRFGHAVVTEDAVGNRTTEGVTVYTTIVNSEPAPVNDFKPIEHDEVSDQMTFQFTASNRLTG